MARRHKHSSRRQCGGVLDEINAAPFNEELCLLSTFSMRRQRRSTAHGVVEVERIGLSSASMERTGWSIPVYGRYESTSLLDLLPMLLTHIQ